MNNNNNNADELNTITLETGNTAPIVKTTQSNNVSSEHIAKKISTGDVASSLILDGYSQSANESTFASLYNRFQLRLNPDLPRSHAALDLILTILCFAAVHITYLGSLNLTSQRSVGLFSVILLVSLVFYAGGMYSAKSLRSLSTELTHVALCWMVTFAALGLIAFLTKTAGDISRVWITASMLLSLMALTGIRVFNSLGFVVSRKDNVRNIAILGNSININPVVRDVLRTSSSQLKIAQIFNLPNHKLEPTTYQSSLEETAAELNDYIEQERKAGDAIEQVWVAVPQNQSIIIEVLTQALIDSSVDVCVVPDQYTEKVLRGDVSRYGNTEIVNVSEVSLPMAADRFKRIFDIIFAAAALLMLGIPMLVVACLVKLESKGPVLFRQKRYGIDGQEIDVLKFRSMVVHKDSVVAQAQKNDARVTRVGRIIRRTSLDELPQLLNVLTGSMSLIGPRPHAVAHNELWRQEIHGYMLRHKAKPGITGWAQVNGWRGETDTAYKMQQRVMFDLDYIRNWSPWLDIKILFLTVFVGFYHKNAY